MSMTIKNASSNNRGQRRNAVVLAAASAVAVLGLRSAPVIAGTSGDAVTISFSGSTAIRGFTISPGFSFLPPSTPITVNSGPGGTPVTYTAPSNSIGFQLAQTDFTQPESSSTTPDGVITNVKAFRVEYHEQGSVEGILELADSQIDDTIQSNVIYDPTDGNPSYVNRNKFATTAVGGANPVTAVPGTAGGHFFDLQGGPNSRNAGAQSRVQIAISDVTAAQGFSRSGTGAFNLTPGSAGYGKGNPALPTVSPNASGGKFALPDESVLNFSQSKIDPSTGTNYVAGNPGETGGVNNLRNNTVAIAATVFAANPGTGLEKLNRTDAQFLQTTGRLANGADFNVVTRDVNSGTRNVASLNVGVDPSFSVGENDAGNGLLTSGTTTQVNIGPGITFSNKTAGGGELRPTVQNARMAIGHLSIGDAIGVSADNSNTRPLRALAFRDDADNTSNGSNATYADPASGTFVQPSAAAIVNGSYVLYQNETYVTAKRADGTYTNNDPATESIKGDNIGNDVRDFRQNILNSVANFPAGTVANPADAAVANSLILPQFMQVKKVQDGINKSVPNPNYNATLSGQFLGSGALTAKFNPAAASAVTTGNASTYGNVTPTQGSIAITARNYLFGDFDQRASAAGVSGAGVRDFSDLDVARRAQAALGTNNDMFAGTSGSNNAVVPGLPSELNGTFTKGDLIVLGDFNADGKFNGEDLRRMARGTTLADSNTSNVLTGSFADSVRSGVLRKNAALDSLQANASPQQRMDAAVNSSSPTAVANAFNKFDVNRDGVVDRKDAAIVDKFIGTSYTSLSNSIGATINSNGSANGGTAVPISLVDVELNDSGQTFGTGVTAKYLNILRDDFNLIKNSEIAAHTLTQGDVNFDGFTESQDLLVVLNHFGAEADSPQLSQWSIGDVTGDGFVESADLLAVLNNFGSEADALSAYSKYDLSSLDIGFDSATNQFVTVPEPTSIAVTGASMIGLLARRRRNPQTRN